MHELLCAPDRMTGASKIHCKPLLECQDEMVEHAMAGHAKFAGHKPVCYCHCHKRIIEHGLLHCLQAGTKARLSLWNEQWI